MSTGRRSMLAGGPGIEATLLLDWTDGEPTVPVANAATGISFELPVAL